MSERANSIFQENSARYRRNRLPPRHRDRRRSNRRNKTISLHFQTPAYEFVAINDRKRLVVILSVTRSEDLAPSSLRNEESIKTVTQRSRTDSLKIKTSARTPFFTESSARHRRDRLPLRHRDRKRTNWRNETISWNFTTPARECVAINNRKRRIVSFFYYKIRRSCPTSTSKWRERETVSLRLRRDLLKTGKFFV